MKRHIHGPRLATTLLALSLIGLSPGANAQEANESEQCTGEAGELRSEVAERVETAGRSCQVVVDLLQTLFFARNDYAVAIKDAATARNRAARQIYDDDLASFRELVEIHEKIRVEAKAQGVLLDDATAQLVQDARAGKDVGETFFGIPATAMTDDENEIKRMKALKDRHDPNYIEMEEFAKAFTPRAQQGVERANAERVKNLKALRERNATYARLRADLRRAYDSGDFPHCLGEPFLESPANKSEAPGSAFLIGNLNVENAPQPHQTPFSKLPGVTPPLPSASELEAKIPPLRDPALKVRLPKEIAFKRDGIFIVNAFNESQERLRDAERAVMAAETMVSVARFGITAAEYVGELVVKVVDGAAQTVLDPLVRNFTDPDKGFIGAAFGTVLDIGFEAVEGVVRSASNLIGDALDVMSPNGLLIQRQTEEANEAARENNLFRAALAVGSSWFGEASNTFDLLAADINRVQQESETADSDETPLEKAARIRAERQQIADIRNEQKKRDKALAVLEGRAFDALNVLGARGTLRAVVRPAGNTAQALENLTNDVRANLRIAQALDDIEGLRARDLTPEIQAKIDDLKLDIDDARRARSDAGAIAEARADLAAAKEGLAALDEAANTLFGRQQQQAARNGQFQQLGQAFFPRENVVVAVGEKLGQGGLKGVFESPTPQVVIQQFQRRSSDGTIRDVDAAVARDIESGKRFNQAGIRTTRDAPFRDANGNVVRDAQGDPVFAVRDSAGNLIKQSERIDIATEAKNIAKQQDGKLTPEQFAAVGEAAFKAVDAGFVMVDLKPANVALVLDQKGKLEVNAFDRDGIIDINQVIESRRNDPSAIDATAGETASVISVLGATFDLATTAGRKKLQSLIIDGPEVCCPEIRVTKDSIFHGEFEFPRKFQGVDAFTLSLTQKLSTKEFEALGTKTGTFSDVAPVNGGKRTSFLDSSRDGVAQTLKDGRKRRLLGDIAENASPDVAASARRAVRANDQLEVANAAADELVGQVGQLLKDVAKSDEAAFAAAAASENIAGTNPNSGDTPGQGARGRGAGTAARAGGGATPEKVAPVDIAGIVSLLEESAKERGQRLAHDAGADDVLKENEAVRNDEEALESDGFPGGK